MFFGIAAYRFCKRKNVGGRATVPPTPGLRAAYSAAYAAAYVEPHRRAVSVFFGPARPARRFVQTRPIFGGKHARAVSR